MLKLQARLFYLFLYDIKMIIFQYLKISRYNVSTYLEIPIVKINQLYIKIERLYNVTIV